MIIDDTYSGTKEKYFEQAQTKTGVLSGVVKTLNDFVKEYDSAKMTMNTSKEELKKNYIQNSAMFDEKNMEIFNTFNESVATIREENKTKIHDIIQQVNDKIAEIIGADIPEGGMNDIKIIRNFEGSLSDNEVKVFLNKYKNCYLVLKTIFDSMTEDQIERLGVNFISADEITDILVSVEATAINMIRTYNGSLPYDFAVMLDGEGLQAVNDAFESFVSTYEG